MSNVKKVRRSDALPITHNSLPLIDEFCDALWLEDGLARNTLDAYRRDLGQFSAWLAGEQGRKLTEGGAADVQAFLGHLFRKKTRASSAARFLSSLKRFY